VEPKLKYDPVIRARQTEIFLTRRDEAGRTVLAEATPEMQAECAIMGHLRNGVADYGFCYYCGVNLDG
jgi:hypothetical protein